MQIIRIGIEREVQDGRTSNHLEISTITVLDSRKYCTSVLLILRGSSPSNDLHQLPCNDGLAGTVEENLKFIDHIACIFRGILAIEISITPFVSLGWRIDSHPLHFDAPIVHMRDLRRGPAPRINHFLNCFKCSRTHPEKRICKSVFP